MRKKALYLWIVIFVLNAADMGLTFYGLQKGAITEGNPLMLFFLKKGIAEALIFKYAGVIILLPLILFMTKVTKLIYTMLWIVAGVLGIVLLMHAHWLFLFFT